MRKGLDIAVGTETETDRLIVRHIQHSAFAHRDVYLRIGIEGRKLFPFLQRIGAVQPQAVGVFACLLPSVDAGQGCGNKENYE